MSEYEQIIDEIAKHGVVINVNKIVDDNYINHERKYVGCVVELDFSEHDKVFEDKIELLNRNLNLQKDKRCEVETERNYLAERINQIKDENASLKQRIAELESEERAKPMRIEFHADNGEILTPLEVANALINHDAFKVDELKELAEYLQVYCRHHSNRDVEQISF